MDGLGIQNIRELLRETERLTFRIDLAMGYPASAGEAFSTDLPAFVKFNLFAKVDAATDIRVKLSPDGGETAYDKGRVIAFFAAGDDTTLFEDVANWIEVSTSKAVTLTLQIFGII